MSVLSQKIYILIGPVCQNESQERSSCLVNEDRHKGDTNSQTRVSFDYKGDKMYNSIDSIYAGLPPPCIRNAVWLIHISFILNI
jgi:hypothetical protein